MGAFNNAEQPLPHVLRLHSVAIPGIANLRVEAGVKMEIPDVAVLSRIDLAVEDS